MKKDKRINNDLQNITQKTEDQKNTNLTRNGGKGGGVRGVNSDAPEGEAVPAPHLAPVVLLLLLNPLISHK
jgi:hypothetical protein